MKINYEIKVTTNDTITTVFVDSAKLNETKRAEVQAVVNLSVPEERETVIAPFIANVNAAMKNRACESIVCGYCDDMVKGVISRVTYGKFKYNATENTLSYDDVAQVSKTEIFVTFKDLLKYLGDYNADHDDVSKLSITGEFKGTTARLLNVFRCFLTGELTGATCAKVAEIVNNNAEIFADDEIQQNNVKGFAGLQADQSASLSVQQKIMDFFYAEFNKKTGKSVKAVKKFDGKNGEKIHVFDFIKAEVVKVDSRTKSIKFLSEQTLLNTLCNMYITAEQVANFKNHGEKLRETMDALESAVHNASADNSADANENLLDKLEALVKDDMDALESAVHDEE